MFQERIYPEGRWGVRGVIAVRLLLALASGGLAGCGDIVLNWPARSDQDRRTSAKPAPKPLARPRQVARSDRPAAQPAEPVTVTDEPAFYQLVLLSASTPGQAPAGLRYVHLVQGPARGVGEMLSYLVIPTGPAGTQHRYTLLYPTKAEWNGAANRAALLDAKPVADGFEQAPGSMSEAFRFGLGIVYGTRLHVPDTARRFRAAVRCLTQVLNASDQEADRRWSAGMIAGAILAERLGDYEQAEQCYAAAQAVVPPGSYERMAALYARAGGQIQNGRPDVARKLCDQILAQFPGFRASEIAGRCEKMIDELDRNR